MRDNTIKPEQFRRKDRNRKGYHFISDERFISLTIGIRKQGAVIHRGGEEVEEYLDRRRADALTIGKDLFFRQQVTISEVVEEVYHYYQNQIGLNSDKEANLMMILNEIDAKQFIIDNAKVLSIPRKEVDETKQQLEVYKIKLKKWEDEHNV